MLSIFKSGTHMEWSRHRTGTIWALCPGLCILGIPDTLCSEQLIPLAKFWDEGWKINWGFFCGGGGGLSQWQGALLLLKCLFLFYMASTVWILLPLSLDFPGNVFFFIPGMLPMPISFFKVARVGCLWKVNHSAFLGQLLESVSSWSTKGSIIWHCPILRSRHGPESKLWTDRIQIWTDIFKIALRGLKWIGALSGEVF